MSSATQITISSMHSLPVELIELIITDLWSQNLSNHDRATFMKSSVCVNRKWMDIFLRVFCTDVHIPSAGFALYFLAILRGESPFYNGYAYGNLDRHCRSISFQRDNNALYPEHKPLNEHPMALAIYAVLQAIFFTPYILPRLRRISIQYNNSFPEDFFKRNKFIAFPPQVTDLELRFCYHPKTPPRVLHAIKSSQNPMGLIPGSLRCVRRLHVIGASEGVIKELAASVKLEIYYVQSPAFKY